MSDKKKLATVWLDGCSGCHMSFLDIDELLVELAGKIDLVYSPLVDQKTFPEHVDIALVEGAVSTDEDREKIEHIRARTGVLVSLGDCAVTGNIPSMRNAFTLAELFDRSYVQNATLNQQVPKNGLPVLLDRVRPVHEIVPVDVYVPGCPPPAEAIYYVLAELLEGREPVLMGHSRFGA